MANDRTTPAEVTNLAVLRGAIVNDPVERVLASGSTVVQFDVSTEIASADADERPARASVPVSWHDPSASARAAIQGAPEILVIGSVRRRFFRVGGATQSRTEVVATDVIPARRRRAVESAVARVVDSLA
jgi:single-strand DNA-binding protein